MADADGVVRATDKAIARRAVVREEAAAEALERFQGPDTESRTPDNEGRRIEKIPGGYLILRYVELANVKTRAEQREATRKRVARHRARRTSDNVTQCNVTVTRVTDSDVDVDADVDADNNIHTSASPTSEPDGSKSPPYSQIQAAWNDMAKTTGLATAREMTAKRKTALRVRWANSAWRASWQEALSKIPSSPFLLGSGKSGWKANFDWFIRPDTVNKILEGQYNGGRRPDRESVEEALEKSKELSKGILT